MKVVCCKNCGAKYQLDDNDDLKTFECSSCAGELEYLEDYSDSSEKSHSSFIDSFRYDNSYIVQCEDCGLKYKIKKKGKKKLQNLELKILLKNQSKKKQKQKIANP